MHVSWIGRKFSRDWNGEILHSDSDHCNCWSFLCDFLLVRIYFSFSLLDPLCVNLVAISSVNFVTHSSSFTFVWCFYVWKRVCSKRLGRFVWRSTSWNLLLRFFFWNSSFSTWHCMSFPSICFGSDFGWTNVRKLLILPFSCFYWSVWLCRRSLVWTNEQQILT